MGAPAYNMYSAAPDYSRLPERRTTRRTPNTRSTRSRTPNMRPSVQQSSKSAPKNLLAIALVVVALLSVVSALSFARVAISSAAITKATETKSLTSQIEEARSEGNQLEIDATVVSNASSVSIRAKALGMTTPESVEVITLDEDVVAQDESGNLLLGESIRRAGNMTN